MNRRPVSFWQMRGSYCLTSLSFAFGLALVLAGIVQPALAKQDIENKLPNCLRTEILQPSPILVYDGRQAHLLKFNQQNINSCGYALGNLPEPEINFAGRIHCDFLEYPITITAEYFYDTSLGNLRPDLWAQPGGSGYVRIVSPSRFNSREIGRQYQFLIGREPRPYITWERQVGESYASGYPYNIPFKIPLSNLYNVVAGISNETPITVGAFEAYNQYEPEFYYVLPGTATTQLADSRSSQTKPLAGLLFSNNGARFLKKMVLLGNRDNTFDRGVLSVYERHLAEDVYASSVDCVDNGVFYLPGPNGYDGQFAFCNKEKLGRHQALVLLKASADHAREAGKSDFAAQAYEDMASFLDKRFVQCRDLVGKKPEIVKYEYPNYLRILMLATSRTPIGLTYEQCLLQAISLREKAGDNASMSSRMVELLQYQVLMGKNYAAMQTFSELEKMALQPGMSDQVLSVYLQRAVPIMVASRINNSLPAKIAFYSRALSTVSPVAGGGNAFYGLLSDVERYCRICSLAGEQDNADQALKLLSTGISLYESSAKKNYMISPQLIIDYLSLNTPTTASLKILSNRTFKNRSSWYGTELVRVASVLVPALVRAKLDADATSLVKIATVYPLCTVKDLSDLRSAILRTQKNEQIEVTPQLSLMNSILSSEIDKRNVELQTREIAGQKAKKDAAISAERAAEAERARQLVVTQDLELASSLSHQAENQYAETMLEIKLRRGQTGTKLLPSYLINAGNIRGFEKAAASLCASVDLYSKHCKPNSYDVVYSNAKAIMCYIMAGREEEAKSLYKLVDTNLAGSNLSGAGYTMSQALNDYAQILNMEGFEAESKKVASLVVLNQSSNKNKVK